MSELRVRIAAICGWMLIVCNVDRLFAPLELSVWVYVTAAAAFGLIVLRQSTSLQSPGRVAAGFIGVFLFLKLVAGSVTFGEHLALTVTEACLVGITTVLCVEIRRCVDQFEEAAIDAALIKSDSELPTFDVDQSEIYREIRRAREFDRPLSLVTISATEDSIRCSMNRLLEEIQRKAVDKYVHARILEFLSSQTKHCDLITRRNSHFVMLLPETDGQQAHEMARRLQQTAANELGLSIRTGTASFPDQEVTFAGLLERAEAKMAGYELTLVSEDGSHAEPRLPA